MRTSAPVPTTRGERCACGGGFELAREVGAGDEFVPGCCGDGEIASLLFYDDSGAGAIELHRFSGMVD
jgi:hypothetical protein